MTSVGSVSCNGRAVSEEDYTYQGGMYVFNGYSEWYDREWEGYGRESFVEDIESMAGEDGKIPQGKMSLNT